MHVSGVLEVERGSHGHAREILTPLIGPWLAMVEKVGRKREKRKRNYKRMAVEKKGEMRPGLAVLKI